MKLKNIYVIRHGETDWNKNQRFQGQTDVQLNETGRDQALALRPFLNQLEIESLYSSPLSRAVETAQLATQDLKLTLRQDDRLRETNIGEAEGLTHSEVIEKFGELSLVNWRSYEERLLDFRFPKGESKRQLMFRVREVFLDIAQNSNRTSVAVFAHGMVMRAMTFVFSSGLAWDPQVFCNGCIHQYTWSDELPEQLIYKGRIY